MTTRRNLLLAATAVAATAVPLRPRPARAADDVADFLFVQTASAMTFDKPTSKLTLEGIGATTCSSRTAPSALLGTWIRRLSYRSGARARTAPFRSAERRLVAFLEADKLQQVVVVLEGPELNGNDLTHTVKVVGEMPEKGSEVSVFIDIIGMPLTPLSYAGAARRGFRQAVLY
ncbi:hypothetical protein [Allomesorhizobium alhagi]|jgi:hypothetical protein|uniref:Uncharacterized protein n=1 Tax=Mesorhizobium alhagi CCNWXJ12-2 TaxID=1107882 RepID=H0HY89_9HYPH|nr:hypothetical protein [Mesorhizobium alhagi]EHK54299.1 hypothetical protein MAXJ12_25838 [Mesorhizobium alhagi CCNWXJ12-2]